MLTASRPPIAAVVQQHAEEAALLRHTRSVLLRAPHVKLHHLRRIDDRIAAHLDGLAVAGDYGSHLAEAALAEPGAGVVFAAAVRAIEDRRSAALDKLLAIAEALPDARRGLLSSFGWVSAQRLRGITKALLDAPSAFARQVGLAACAMHQVDPGSALTAALHDADTPLRARALRSAGEQGRVDLLPACLAALNQTSVSNPRDDGSAQFAAARSALLLGERKLALAALQTLAAGAGPHRRAALRLVLMVAAPAHWQALLTALAQDAANPRLLIQAVGAAGDPHYVPWLIKQMHELALTRLAGDSFSLITGVDLAALDLERKPPEGVELGPNDNPNDADVAMDEDDSLPWPDADKIAAWWHALGARFAAGTRYFLGEPPTSAHALAGLKNGTQRQRQVAALYRCLLRPGTPLFCVAAPAWRQQRWLAAMEA